MLIDNNQSVEPPTSALKLSSDNWYAASVAVAARAQAAAAVDRRDRQTDGRADIRPFRRPCTANYAVFDATRRVWLKLVDRMKLTILASVDIRPTTLASLSH